MRFLGTRIGDESGFGLLASLLVLMIVAVLGTTLVSVTMTDLAISANFQASAGAFYAADSGIQQTIVDLAVDNRWTASLFAGGVPLSSPDTLTINGHTVTAPRDRKSGEIVPGYYSLGTAGTIGGSTYTREVYLPLPPGEVEGPDVWVTLPLRVAGAQGSKDPATSVIGVDLRVRVHPGGGPWSYAVAAGDGWGTEAIDDSQGTLQIRGSVRIFGDRANPPQLFWKGSAAVMNVFLTRRDSGPTPRCCRPSIRSWSTARPSRHSMPSSTSKTPTSSSSTTRRGASPTRTETATWRCSTASMSTAT